LKKHRDYEDEMNEATKAKEVTAYEDSWYRSLKALADMRPTEAEVRPAEVDETPVEEDVHPAAEADQAPVQEDVPPAPEVEGASLQGEMYPAPESPPRAPLDVWAVKSDEETSGVPED
jgi:hypothetical protein